MLNKNENKTVGILEEMRFNEDFLLALAQALIPNRADEAFRWERRPLRCSSRKSDYKSNGVPTNIH